MNRFLYDAVLMICFSVMYIGCATPVENKSSADISAIKSAAGKGELFLPLNGDQWYEPQRIIQSRYAANVFDYSVTYIHLLPDNLVRKASQDICKTG